jgi:hypothetical protein
LIGELLVEATTLGQVAGPHVALVLAAPHLVALGLGALGAQESRAETRIRRPAYVCPERGI